MSDKALSFTPIVFIILLISLIAIFWSMYNTFYGSSYQKTTFSQSKVDTFRNEIEKLKGFSKQSLIYSSHLSLIEHAGNGGLMDRRGIAAWICNGPNPPDIQESKECIDKYINYHLNVYIGNYTISLPLTIYNDEFEQSEHNVTPYSILNGEHDEGNFNVLSGTSNVLIKSNDGKITMADRIYLNEEINKTRFWYLYRKFLEWANQQPNFAEWVCDCTKSCQACSCADDAAEKSLELLQSKFDNYVTCEKGCHCCYACRSDGDPGNCELTTKPSCNSYSCFPTDCESWDQAPEPKCTALCDPECMEPSEYFNESYSTKISPINHTNETLMSRSNFAYDIDCCIVYYINKLSAAYTFSCTDTKYNVPGEGAPKPLVFEVEAWASWYAYACPATICPCPC